MLWQKGVKEGTILVKQPEIIGTTFKEIMEDDGNRLEIFGEITGFIRNQLIAFHLKSRIHELDVRYSVEGNESKSTILVDSVIHWKFPLNIMSIFIGRKIKDNILKLTQAEFAELVRRCEAEHASLAKQ